MYQKGAKMASVTERPVCNVCDQEIMEPRCYVLNDFEKYMTCICENCMREQMRKTRGLINFVLQEAIADFIEDRWEETPCRSV